MTEPGALLLRLTLWLAVSAGPVDETERREAGALLSLPAAQTNAVYLRPLTIQLGSTDEEVLAALLRCKREPLGERCDETTFTSESPTHYERVAGFWMARTETTVAEYARCVAVGRCQPAAFQGGARRFERARFPVTLVSVDEAARYCAFRGGRLPTEAEFERAARGAARRAYPWGQSYSRHLANHGRLGVDPSDASDGFAELAPVGSFPGGATPEGVLDLAGNVAEWTADAFVPAYGLPATSDRAVRGGHFASAAPFLRGAARTSRPPAAREPTLGFRCVWSVAPP
jgi:formylglycine-generating enzyme required for sulfatase activity